MTSAASISAKLTNLAGEQGRNSHETHVLYALERFLDRLGRTKYSDDFVLKGGLLLAAYRLRRPTKDADLQALDFQLDEEHLREVVVTVADIDDEDGLAIDATAIRVIQIRDDAEYTGLRVTAPATIHRTSVTIQLDVSTGDPIWPKPEIVELPRLLGGVLKLTGHPIPTVIAEKSVTILQRGTTSTRWRDYVDIRGFQLTQPFTAGDLRAAATAVAQHRGFDLEPLAGNVEAYGAVTGMQAKWTAWRRKEGLEERTESNLDDQLADIVAFLDPVYSGTVSDSARWDPETQTWTE
ncbi:nucleotidyl transferase AbiEii/AbiGii toxin family protein [soil metagenome]